jgi:DNA invertase Pin-like site-specific DNA recombinase
MYAGTDPKIKAGHLSRDAIIYIRRSSPYQVEEHTGSGKHQRSFSELARDYGWADDQIIEIDEDDGKSGTGTTKRTGFQWLRQQIFDEKVGAIFCWEASRLARNNGDFSQLTNLCAACDTLIIDEKGVYDLNNVNDSMSLGHQGVMNHGESRKTGDRSKATRRTLAKAGELRLRRPTGYLYDDDDNLILDPNEDVQKALRLFFSTFDDERSATKVAKRFNRNGIEFPTLIRARGKKYEVDWGELEISRALDILRNPMYAGTYVFGQTKTISKMLAPDSNEQKKKIVKVGLDSDEVVLIHGAHEGYITWEKFTENQKILEDNRYSYGAGFRGAVRDGSALLQGMVVCGKCLGKLTTHYDGRDGTGNYVCSNQLKHRGKYACLAITARRLDSVVTEAAMKALCPAQLQLTLREIEEVGIETQADGWNQKELKTAKAEYAKARLELDDIDPEDTTTFDQYAQKLREKKIALKRLEEKYAKASKARRQELTKEELESLLALPQDVRTFWESETVTNAKRKQLLRCLIHQVIIKRTEGSKYQDIIIRWMTGARTSLTIVMDGRFLHPEAVELMRRLAPDHTIPQIIYELHEAGFKSKDGKEWFSRTAVYQAFRAYGIEFACPEISMNGDEPRGDGRYSSTAVARMLNVSLPTIYRWCDLGILDGIRNGAPKGNNWIKITPEQVSALNNRSVKRMDKSVVEKFKIT